MPKLNIDGIEVDVEDGITLIQACEEAGVEVPRFCYHDRLSVAGNCRMCLVEVVGAPKMVASCAMGVSDLRPGPEGQPPEIKTKSEKVKKAREGTMEFLLINHPLDCPICDQGGECDLQDQAVAFGGKSSRYDENKRAVEDRNIGPLIKTVMTRCISCTRCVRFMTEIAGFDELGQIGRGENAEITTYLDKAILSELSGNVIDLCPVGALTSRPFAFSARPWEMKKTETIDVMDANGANIRIESRGNEVLRITPREHDAVNEEWISDKSRFIWDGLRSQRLDKPYIRDDAGLREATWAEAFTAIATKLKGVSPARVAAIAGDLSGVEEMFALKELMGALGSPNLDCRQDGSLLDANLGRESYVFNSKIEGIDDADLLLIVGSNPRLEASVLNARIYQNWLNGDLPIYVIGQEADLLYDYEHLGNGPEHLVEILNQKSPFNKALKKAKKPMIILGQAAFSREDGKDILALAGRISQELGFINAEQNWNGFNVLHTAAARVGGLDIGFVPGEGGVRTDLILNAAEKNEMEVVFLLGADEIDVNKLSTTFVIYQGSHGEIGAQMADVILPGAAYTEKSATYVNTEGRVQMTSKATFPPGDAKEDWKIIRELSEYLGKPLNFNTIEQLHKELYKTAPHLASLNSVEVESGADMFKNFAMKELQLKSEPFGIAIADFYLSNPIARASAIMAELSALKQERDRGAA